MPTPVNMKVATAVRFEQLHVVNLLAATVSTTPQFPQDQLAALSGDPKTAVHSFDQRTWVALAGWIDEVSTAVVQCRHSGLTLEIKRRQNVSATLLPTTLSSPSATLNYKNSKQEQKSHAFQSSIDAAQGFLRLQIAFDQTPELYDEVFTAMTTPASGITVSLNYQHPIEVKIPAPVTTPPPRVTTPPPQLTTPPPHVIIHPPIVHPPIVHPPILRPLHQVLMTQPAFSPAIALAHPVVLSDAAHLAPNAQVRVVSRDIGRVWVPPPPPQGDRIEEHTFSGSLTFTLAKQQTDTNVFPDLPRNAQNGWDQVPQSPGLHFLDSGKIDTFFYIPTSFKLGFYGEADGANSQPPLRVEVYQNPDGGQRIKATLIALPCLQDDERDTLRAYLHDQVLQKLQPFVYLEPRSGLQADFVADFTSGSADNARTLPLGIQFKALDVVPNDRVKLQFDMPAEQYPIFCNMLLFGISGRIKLSEPQFNAEVPVRLHLEDMTSNLLHLDQVAPQNGPDGKPQPAALSITNLLSYPVQLPSLEVNLLDRGSESGMILDSERLQVLSAATQLAGQADPASKVTFNIAPQRLVGWDTTVVEPGLIKVTAGTAQDWLNRINRDPSLQPHQFSVQLQLLVSDSIRTQVQLIRVRLFKDGDPAVRLSLDVTPAASPQVLHVSMTLAELMGDGGKAPAFSIEYETLAADGSLSPTQRVAVVEDVTNLQLRAMVPSANTIFSIDQDGVTKDIVRAELDTLIPQLRTNGKHWEIFTREPAPQTTTTPTPTTTTAPPAQTNPSVSVVTDLVAAKLGDGTLSRVFLVFKADQDNAPQSSFTLDATHHDAFTWQPQGVTIPPFRWEITFLYANNQVKQAKGVSLDLTLIPDPPAVA